MTRLLGLAAAIGAAFVVLSFTPLTTKDELDPVILLFIGILFSLCCLVMLLFTRRWTIRGLGVLAALLGDAVLYTTSGVNHYTRLGQTAHLFDLARASFVVGGVLLAIGLVLWVNDNRKALNLGWRDAEPTHEHERNGLP